MALSHAVVWLDHHQAVVQKFNSDEAQVHRVRDQRHETRYHANNVRAVHEFFAAVCDALDGPGEILVLSARMPQADFRHYVDRHRPALTPRIVGWEIAEHQSDAQMLAQARRFFTAHDRMLGKRPPS